MQAEKEKADLVLLSNAIYSGLSYKPFPGAVIIKNNTILDVRNDQNIKNYVGSKTILLQFKDKLIMPGFHDSHVHMILGGLSQESINLQSASSEEEASKMVFDYTKRNNEEPWILGFSWHHLFWEKKTLPHRSSLDRLIPDKPVFLLNSDGHGAWVNTMALKICKIDKETPDPPFGKIEKDEKGEPTGFLYETAMGLATKYSYRLPADKQKKVIRKFLSKACKVGITSISDLQPFAGTDIGDPNIYKELEDNNHLTLRIHFSTMLDGDLSKAKLLSEKYNSKKLVYSGFKEFLDGVVTTYTAYMLESYSDNPNYRGNTVISPQLVKDRVIEADKECFRVRLHACGDNAVRLGLDSFEAARISNGIKKVRHAIEHLESIHPDDIKRFCELGVTASMQPEHLAISEKFNDNPYHARLGSERGKYLWPLKSLITQGARIAFGSDYPVVDLNPMLGIYRALTRLHNDNEPKGGWNPQERISLREALKAYTYESAFAISRENDIGLLHKGYLADIIVLDRNPFETNEKEILNTNVLLTIFDGKIVFEASL